MSRKKHKIKKHQKHKKQKAGKSPFIFEELEPRLMMSADGMAAAVDMSVDGMAAAMDETYLEEQVLIEEVSSAEIVYDPEEVDLAEVDSQPSEIVFIDTAVEDYESLMSGIDTNVEIVLLDRDSDGIEQIAETLQGRSDVDAIHLIAEGNAAELHLGGSFLTQESISGQYAELFKQIGDSLSENADLLIYGCNFGQGEAGLLAVESLAGLTGADIAASDDRTGHTNEYGDWLLEVNTGQIESSVVISEGTQATWEEAMATYTVTNTNDSGAGSLRQAIIDANANSGADNIYFDISAALVDGAHTINLLSALPDITDYYPH